MGHDQGALCPQLTFIDYPYGLGIVLGAMCRLSFLFLNMKWMVFYPHFTDEKTEI